MIGLIDITSSILSKNVMCFDTKNIDTQKITLPFEEAKFGILNFNAVTSKQTDTEHEFLFVIDRSGSMSDICSDGRTKMRHILHTLKNMILFFHENSTLKININVIAFDTRTDEIIARTKITHDNLDEIIFKIEKISPRDSTNIELALNQSLNKINELKNLYPNNRISHIFMTDGEATDGSNDITTLKNLVVPDINNAFIGFGIDHDSALLNEISSVGKSAYYFIDKLESAGLVYGEILHGLIYNLLTEAEINIENGLIYDFKTNDWKETLKIGDIASEANKTYNIISTNPENCKAHIKANMDDLEIIFPSILFQDLDLTNHIYRQRTLQMLYEVNEFCNRKRQIENNNNFTQHFMKNHIFNNEDIHKQQASLKKKLSEFLLEIKKYIVHNNLQNDKILKNLCDDIYICHRTLGTRYENMFCTSRQTAQGTQRQYTVSNTGEVINDDFNSHKLSPKRCGTPLLNLEDIEESDIQLSLLNHEMSNFEDTPYLTPQAAKVMRSVSSGIEYEGEIKYEDGLEYCDALNIV